MSSQRVILHIGYPKCASSSIQAFFADHDRLHRQHGLCYPAAGRLRVGYRSHEPLFRPDLSDARLRQILDAIGREAADARMIFLSSEVAMARLNQPWLLRRCVDELGHRYGPENVTVLMVLRNHFDLAQSAYAQFIRGGLYSIDRKRFFRKGKPGIARYFRMIAARDGFYPFDVGATVGAIRQQIGMAELRLVSMHEADLGCGIVEHVAKMTDVPPPEAQRAPQVNARPSARALLAMSYAYGRYRTRDVQRQGDRIARHFADIEDVGRVAELHGSRRFHDLVSRCQDADRAVLAGFPGRFDAVLQRPAFVSPGPAGPNSRRLDAEDRDAVDALLRDSLGIRLTPAAMRPALRNVVQRLSRWRNSPG